MEAADVVDARREVCGCRMGCSGALQRTLFQAKSVSGPYLGARDVMYNYITLIYIYDIRYIFGKHIYLFSYACIHILIIYVSYTLVCMHIFVFGTCY